MNENEINLKLKLKKVDELTALRTSVIYVLIILVGGTIGLMLTFDTPLKVVLICTGWYYIFITISNINNINSQINKLLRFQQEEK